MAYDPRVVQAIARYARKHYAGGGWKPWEKKLGRSAYATGIVESGLRNLGYGDADSQGWRQERAQYYDNPRNVNASVARYFQEAEPFARQGQNVQNIAQNAQQSAFPSRYGDVRGEAIRLFRKNILKGGGGGEFNPGDRRAGEFNMPRMPGQIEGSSRYERLLETFNRMNEAANPQQQQEDPNAPNYLSKLQDDTSSMLEQNSQLIQHLRDMNDPRTPTPGDDEASKQLPKDTPQKLQTMIERATKMDKMHKPYLWGGGHGASPDMNGPWDCSGAVSAVLGVDPRVSGQFAQWGKAGRGKRVTIYANAHHVLMEINGRFFGTSGSNPGGGAGWIPRTVISKSYLSQFTARHPAGL